MGKEENVILALLLDSNQRGIQLPRK